MPYLFTHLVLCWLPAKLYEKIRHTHLGRTSWVLLFLGTLFPDSSFLIDWLFHTRIHRTFTHSLLMILLAFFAITFLYGTYKKNYRTAASYGFTFAFGIFIHILLDSFGPQGIPLFWPSLQYYSFVDGVKDVSLTNVQLFTQSYAEVLHAAKALILDTVVGVMWLGYLFVSRKLQTF